MAENPIISFINSLSQVPETVDTVQAEAQAVKGYMILTLGLLILIAVRQK